MHCRNTFIVKKSYTVFNGIEHGNMNLILKFSFTADICYNIESCKEILKFIEFGK